MPHVSRIKLKKEVETQLLQTLHLVLTKVHQEDHMADLLSALLTPTEKLMLAKRLAISVLLEEGISDSEIASTLHVTRVTVSRLRYYYESRGKGYQIALSILKNEEVMRIVRKSLLKVLGYAARAAGGYVKPTIL